MKLTFIIFLLFTTAHLGWSQSKEPLVIGETVKMKSEILNEERVLNIYLPEGYNTDVRYPVIYLLDGSKNEDFIHITGIVQFGSFSWINMLSPSIVVGIANVDRKRDFTYPTTNAQDKKEFPTAGGSANFMGFIEKELQPYIDAQYSTTPEKTIIGQSLGGLLAAEILHKKPSLFHNYIIVSPSMWWDDNSLIEKNLMAADNVQNIYVAVGTEGSVMQVGATRLFYKMKHFYKDKAGVFYNFLEEQDHGDALHLAVYDAFEKIYQKDKKADD